MQHQQQAAPRHSFKSLKRMEVQVTHLTPAELRPKDKHARTRWVNPGDPIPEASGWSNPALWVKRGFIQEVAGAPWDSILGHKHQPPRAMTPADYAHRERTLAQRETGSHLHAKAFDNASENPALIGPGKTPEGQLAPAAVDEAAEAAVDAEVDAEVEKRRAKAEAEEKELELEDLDKKELKEVADKLGIQYSARATNQELIEAIRAAAPEES